MKVSVVVTVRNEESTISALLESFIRQSVKPAEIVIVDGGSTDKTVEIIRHFQKKDGRIRLLVERCPRARGRNLGVELARGEIIAMTDAGCVAEKNWLKKLTQPFETGEVDMVAGFYKMVGETPLQKAMMVFLGVMPENFDMNFLPSTRSTAFTKALWERVGGFPEREGNSAEDTEFNLRAVGLGARIARVKTARVEWGMPVTLQELAFKIREYARWDVKYLPLWQSTHGFRSHNIKVLLVFTRYLAGLTLLLLGIFRPVLLVLLLLLVFFYCLRAYKKAGLWGIALQFVTDLAVMSGFAFGLAKR